MKKIFLFFIAIYQVFLANIFALLGIQKKNSCPFYPSCSEYSRLVFKKYPPFKAFLMSLRRFIKCHPWKKPEIDQP